MREYGLSAAEQDQLWEWWRAGRSISAIARVLGRPLQHVRRYLTQTGGIRPTPPRPPAAHLSLSEREEISRGVAAGLSARQISTVIGRPASTVSREIARHGGRSVYRAQAAHDQATANRRRPKPTRLSTAPQLRAIVEAKLALCWSPDQVSGWLVRCHPDDPAMRVSAETIYRSLFDPRRRDLDRRLTRRLRRGRALRYPRARRDGSGRGRIPDMVTIPDRPAEVDDRAVPGHWESQWCCQAA